MNYGYTYALRSTVIFLYLVAGSLTKPTFSPRCVLPRYAVGCGWHSRQANKRMCWPLLFLVLLLTLSLPSEGMGMPYLAVEQEDRAVTGSMPSGSREASAEPPLAVTDSTIMFLHVFKVSKAPRRTNLGTVHKNNRRIPLTLVSIARYTSFFLAVCIENKA